MKQVILNADDFGKNIEQNKAIDDSFKQGLICSAGLIITGKYMQDAINKAKNGGYVKKLHLHVNLSSGRLIPNTDYVPLTKAMQKNPFIGSNGHLMWCKKKSFNIITIIQWRRVYNEIEAQYKKFIDITNGQGNIKHIDFHLWYNLTWPTAIALGVFTRKYKIHSVRYLGQHDKNNLKKRLFRILSWDPGVKTTISSNIDYFLSKPDLFSNYPIVELYCHPCYKNGKLIDDSQSYLGHEKKTMQYQFSKLQELKDIEFTSWEINM